MKPTIRLLVMAKKVGGTIIFKLGMATGLGEGKLLVINCVSLSARADYLGKLK